MIIGHVLYKMHVPCPTWLSYLARNTWALAPTGGPGGLAPRVGGAGGAAAPPRGFVGKTSRYLGGSLGGSLGAWGGAWGSGKSHLWTAAVYLPFGF